MIRIAFLINFNYKVWFGGTNLIKNLIYCIKKYSKNKFQPVLIVRKSLKSKDLKEFKGIKVIKSDIFDQNLLRRILIKIQILLFGKSSQLESFFKKHKISLISHSNVLAYNFFTGEKSKIKCISWIADFQYLYFPKNFTLKTIILRKLNILMCIAHTSKILLSSYDAQKDLKKVSEKAYKKSAVSQFYFESPKKGHLLSLNYLRNKFKLSNKFFYLPNQYWVHKNHITVLKALKYLKNKNYNFTVVSTGHKEDHRDSSYFDKIQKYIKLNDLQINYKYIGVVNYLEVLSLMYHCVALINPSKFEGRHSSLEQARSLGKQMLLSKINIHKEQAAPRSLYFNKEQSFELAKLMKKTWLNYSSKKNSFFYNKAVKQNKLNLIKYYKNWEKVALEVLNSNL